MNLMRSEKAKDGMEIGQEGLNFNATGEEEKEERGNILYR